MDDKEFLDFLQKQKDFEYEETKGEARAKEFWKVVLAAAKARGTTVKQLLERLARSPQNETANLARKALSAWSEVNEKPK